MFAASLPSFHKRARKGRLQTSFGRRRVLCVLPIVCSMPIWPQFCHQVVRQAQINELGRRFPALTLHLVYCRSKRRDSTAASLRSGTNGEALLSWIWPFAPRAISSLQGSRNAVSYELVLFQVCVFLQSLIRT